LFGDRLERLNPLDRRDRRRTPGTTRRGRMS